MMLGFKILFLVQAEQRAILDRLYDGIQAHCVCDLRWLSDKQQADLKGYFLKEIDVHAYDCILLFLRFKKEIRQVAFISTIPNLVILEHDAYQNYILGKYKGRFSKHYRALPSARVITSGFGVANQLREEGVDAVFVPKGYDQALLRDLALSRDIELGFVGSIKSGVYSARREFLEALALVEPLYVARTNSGVDYLHMLNRIRFFVSADIGMGEYMIKNFEAMACGCVLITYDQGEDENRALGFVDMDNVVLYRSLKDFRTKLQTLRRDSSLADRIAANGRQLVEEKYQFSHVGKAVVDALQTPFRQPQPSSIWLRARRYLGI